MSLSPPSFISSKFQALLTLSVLLLMFAGTIPVPTGANLPLLHAEPGTERAVPGPEERAASEAQNSGHQPDESWFDQEVLLSRLHLEPGPLTARQAVFPSAATLRLVLDIFTPPKIRV